MTEKERILMCLNNIGIYVDSLDNEFNIQDYILDSITFITFIVELENMFDIEIPDMYLVPDEFKTIDDVCRVIKHLKDKKEVFA